MNARIICVNLILVLVIVDLFKMEDNFDTLSQLSEGFMQTDTQSVCTEFSQNSSFVDEALIEALRLEPGKENFDNDEFDEEVELPKHACELKYS